MAIGVIAVAFVALFALLPAGLNDYRAAINQSNETWITQNINSMVQTTDFKRIPDLDFVKTGEIYYYDEEGRLVDQETAPTSDPVAKASRIYGVKLLVERLYRPGTEATEMTNGWRILIVMSPIVDQRSQDEFKKINTPDDLITLQGNSQVRTRALVVARMDSAV